MCSTLTTTAASPGHLTRFRGPVDLAPVLADPAKAAGTGIALGDRVGCDQTECSPLPKEIEGSAEEVGDDV